MFMAKDLMQNLVSFETVIRIVNSLDPNKKENASGSSLVSSDDEIFISPKTVSES